MEIFLGIIVLLSLITFCFYAADKNKAEKHKWRVPEKVLLLLSFIGGALGGTLAMYGLRHKNRHWYFVVINIGSLIIHCVIAFLIYKKIGFIFI